MAMTVLALCLAGCDRSERRAVLQASERTSSTGATASAPDGTAGGSASGSAAVHAGAGSTAATPVTAAAVVTHQVSPTATDPAIVGPDDPNLAVVGAPSQWNGKLVVFLPGTGGKPGCCQMFLTEAAALGFHAIGLTYNNTVAVGAKCMNNLTCYGTVRRNVFDGADRTLYSSLSPTDGVEHRLAALLAYLVRTYPTEGWGTFLSGALPSYGLTVMSGHSQGGGEAAFIGTQRRLPGVVSLSSPPDTNDNHQAAPWLSAIPGGPTAGTQYFGFFHQGDPFASRIQADWTAMGLDALGPLTSVDNAGPPYGQTHELTSSAPLPRVVLAAHDSTAVDNAQPLCPDGRSAYTPVWAYLLDRAAALAITASGGGCTSA